MDEMGDMALESPKRKSSCESSSLRVTGEYWLLAFSRDDFV
jgi:hypothetical protein